MYKYILHTHLQRVPNHTYHVELCKSTQFGVMQSTIQWFNWQTSMEYIEDFSL